MKNIFKTLLKVLFILLFFLSIATIFKGLFISNLYFIFYGVVTALFSGSLVLKYVFMKKTKVIDTIHYISLSIIILIEVLSLFGVTFL